MTIQAIYKRVIDGGFPAKVVQYNSGKYAVIVDGFETVNFWNGIERLFKRAKVHIDYHIYAEKAFIMDAADYAAHKDYSEKMTKLTDVFWEAIHAGKNQNEAKQIQYNYAVEHNCIENFNEIYA